MRPLSPLKPVKVAVLADTESRWKWGLATAKSLSPGAIDYYLRSGPGLPNDRQLAESGVDPALVTQVSIGEVPAHLAQRQYDVLVLALPGDAVQAVLQAFAAQWTTPNRPIIVTGYVGIVYERLIEGLYQRAGADVVIANSPADAATFGQLLGAIGYSSEAVVAEPLPFLRQVGEPVSESAVALTFAAQPDVPSRKSDRRYVVQRLAAYAARNPQRPVLLKVRGLTGERLTHPEPYPYQQLLAGLKGDVPANLKVVSGPMGDALDQTGLLVTVSSTAAAEAIHRGIPTAILTDFGVREELGNHFFAGSGCYASFDEIDDGVQPTADPAWAVLHGLTAMPSGALAQRVAELRGQSLPAVRPYFDQRRSPVYLGRLLREHGLDSEATLANGGGLRSRLTKPLARTLYRIGTGVIAPILRRLGEG